MKLLAVVMCKAPVSGRVKTRLLPAIHADDAAALHAAMARDAVARAARVFGAGWIAADEPEHPFFARFSGWRIVPQGAGDLGARMERLALQAIGRGCRRLVFTGTDSPHMPDARLRALRAMLADGADLAIAPVEDGGYEAIGLGARVMQAAAREGAVRLFRDIAWSSDRVLAQTLRQAERMGVKARLLEPGFDIDTPEDLARARRGGWRPR